MARTGTEDAHRNNGGRTAVLVDALVHSELLPGIGASGFNEIGDELRAVHLAPGEHLVNRGDVADQVFVVIEGQLEVILETPTGTQRLSLLNEGVVIGEIGLLAGDTRSTSVRAVTECELVAVSAAGLGQLLAAHPAHAEDLARRATQRLRRTQLIEHFTSQFGVVDADVLATIESLMEWVTVPAGTRLFAQGEPGDAAYLVATGRLRAFRRGPNGVEVEIGEMGRAELVGEMSLIDGGARGASVYAVRDSQLVRFSSAAFEELLNRYPRVGLEVAQIALRRTRVGLDRDRDRRLSFVLVPASPGLDMDGFAERLATALGPDAHRVSSARVDTALGRQGIAQITDDDVGALRLAYHLEELEERHRFLVYDVDESWTSWSKRALRWADHVVLVADARQDPQPSALERELWSLVSGQHHPKVSLALLHPADTTLPTGTAAWLDPRNVESHHHLREGDPEHLARLARLLSGTGLSLVFGGGGARGFAHLGVLDVLAELEVPIDMIGGTSIGSIMAVGPAMGWSAATSRQTAVDAFRKLFDYTLPTTSLLRGERITSKLQQQLGDVDIADLWIPYFCVSTNLTHARAEFHDRGSLVTGLRASIAIPGVLPPVPHDGDLLVDGGVLDNVPVDEMRRRNPTGRIIAIDVAPVDGPVAERDYGLSVSGFRGLFGRHRGGRPPNLVSTMVRSSLIASVRDRQRVVDENIADLYVDVAVDGGGALDFSAAEQIADSAATSTRPIITRWLAGEREATTSYVRAAPARRPVIDPEHRRRRGGVLLLTRRDFQFRAARFGAVIAGVSVVFALLFLMTGLTEQFHREPRDTVHAFGAQSWLLRDGASGAFTSAATMPAGTASLVSGVGASPVVVGRHSITSGAKPIDIVVVGYQSGHLGQPSLASGQYPAAPDEIVIDDSSGIKIGETVQIGDQHYRVTGHSSDTTLFAGMALVYMDLHSAQALLYRGQDLATAILLDGRPAAVPAGFITLSADQVADDAMRPLEHAISSVNLIRVLLWFVAAMIIGTMIYLSALERRRDVAVLKAIGGSTVHLGTSIALQGALIALAAALIASVLQVFMVPLFPLKVTVPGSAFLQVPLIAVAVALAAGAVGLRKAIRTDPALAFAGPGS